MEFTYPKSVFILDYCYYSVFINLFIYIDIIISLYGLILPACLHCLYV